jgi:hypothetical protein
LPKSIRSLDALSHVSEVSCCRDLSRAHKAIANGLQFDDNVPLINYDNIIIWKSIIFKIMEPMKI